MLRNQNIICFSSIDWDFIWQGHQEIMSTLAKNENRILFVENTGVRSPSLSDAPRLIKRLSNWNKGVGGIRQNAKNLYIYSPLVFPFPYSRLARWLNAMIMARAVTRWMNSFKCSDPIAWVFLPTGTVLSTLKRLSVKLVVYYCIDDFSKSSKAARRVVKTERQLLKKADLVFVTSQRLYEKSAQFNKNVFLFPFGVNIDHFKPFSRGIPEKPPELRNLKTPLIGYIGGIHRWVDQGLVKEVARRHPDCSFAFVGPIQTDVKELSEEKNIVFLGQKANEELPRYVCHFSVCLIPYKMAPYTENVYPTKLNEYLALGKPVISTPLREILKFNQAHEDIVVVGDGPEEFNRQLDLLLASGIEGNNVDRDRRIAVAAQNSWAARIDQMSDRIEEVLQREMEDQENRWRQNLLFLYQTARKSVIKAVVTVLSVYLLVFQTPLLWWVAGPLRHSDPVRKSDLIAVLGGGVGESGLAGEGYQERVKQGVNLFLSGYADRLVLSSGYRYSFQEVEVMKALAVELGVPKEKIILEKRPASTYDHLVCLREILEKNRLNSVIVISSPYHMRRVNAVSKKVLAGYGVLLVPVERSMFFGNYSAVKPRHIRAIIHEYLALLYYGYKRYL